MTTTFDQDGVLARLHRYQTMLVMGGGIAITVLVLLAAVLEVVASVMTYVARTNEEVSVDVRHVMDFTARATATLRNNVQNMELAWERAEAPTASVCRPTSKLASWYASMRPLPRLRCWCSAAPTRTIPPRPGATSIWRSRWRPPPQ